MVKAKISRLKKDQQQITIKRPSCRKDKDHGEIDTVFFNGVQFSI
jgi:hypothetical protein